jgi:hypothetical protein
LSFESTTKLFEALSRYWQHLSAPQKFGISQQWLKSCSPLLSEALLLGCIVLGPGRDWWSHEPSQPFRSEVMSGINKNQQIDIKHRQMEGMGV